MDLSMEPDYSKQMDIRSGVATPINQVSAVAQYITCIGILSRMLYSTAYTLADEP